MIPDNAQKNGILKDFKGKPVMNIYPRFPNILESFLDSNAVFILTQNKFKSKRRNGVTPFLSPFSRGRGQAATAGN